MTDPCQACREPVSATFCEHRGWLCGEVRIADLRPMPGGAMSEIPWWASEDPWALSPEEAAAMEAKRRAFEAAKAEIPDEPPY